MITERQCFCNVIAFRQWSLHYTFKQSRDELLINLITTCSNNQKLGSAFDDVDPTIAQNVATHPGLLCAVRGKIETRLGQHRDRQ